MKGLTSLMRSRRLIIKLFRASEIMRYFCGILIFTIVGALVMEMHAVDDANESDYESDISSEVPLQNMFIDGKAVHSSPFSIDINANLRSTLSNLGKSMASSAGLADVYKSLVNAKQRLDELIPAHQEYTASIESDCRRNVSSLQQLVRRDRNESSSLIIQYQSLNLQLSRARNDRMLFETRERDYENQVINNLNSLRSMSSRFQILESKSKAEIDAIDYSIKLLCNMSSSASEDLCAKLSKSWNNLEHVTLIAANSIKVSSMRPIVQKAIKMATILISMRAENLKSLQILQQLRDQLQQQHSQEEAHLIGMSAATKSSIEENVRTIQRVQTIIAESNNRISDLELKRGENSERRKNNNVAIKTSDYNLSAAIKSCILQTNEAETRRNEFNNDLNLIDQIFTNIKMNETSKKPDCESCPEDGICLYVFNVSGDIKSQQCVCNKGFYGDRCRRRKCPGFIASSYFVAEHPGACSGHGSCHSSGECKCIPPYSGNNCGVLQCQNDCSDSNGNCNNSTGICNCKFGNAGIDCSGRSCVADCGNGGVCDTTIGKCACIDPFFGGSCQNKKCPDNCGENGTCYDTLPSTAKVDSSIQTILTSDPTPSPSPSPSPSPPSPTSNQSPTPSPAPSPSPSSQKTSTTEIGTCQCRTGYSGSLCEYIRCPLDCSSHGICLRYSSTCVCHYGYAGLACDTRKELVEVKPNNELNPQQIVFYSDINCTGEFRQLDVAAAVNFSFCGQRFTNSTVMKSQMKYMVRSIKVGPSTKVVLLDSSGSENECSDSQPIAEVHYTKDLTRCINVTKGTQIGYSRVFSFKLDIPKEYVIPKQASPSRLVSHTTTSRESKTSVARASKTISFFNGHGCLGQVLRMHIHHDYASANIDFCKRNESNGFSWNAKGNIKSVLISKDIKVVFHEGCTSKSNVITEVLFGSELSEDQCETSCSKMDSCSFPIESKIRCVSTCVVNTWNLYIGQLVISSATCPDFSTDSAAIKFQMNLEKEINGDAVCINIKESDSGKISSAVAIII